MDTYIRGEGAPVVYQALQEEDGEPKAALAQEEDGLFDGKEDMLDDIVMLAENAEAKLDAAIKDGDIDAAKEAADELEDAGAKAKEVDTDAAIEKVDKLNQELEDLLAKVDKAFADLEIAKKDLAEEESFLKDAKEDYKKLQGQYDEKADDYNDITKKIDKATENLAAQQKADQQKAIYTAMSKYNEEEDGDWNEYLQGSLKEVCDDSVIANTISSLGNEQSGLARELGGLKIKMDSQANIVNTTQAAVATLKNNVAALEETVTTTNAAIETKQNEIVEAILGTISCEEMALVEENGIDLKEKHPDGSPKYVFAKGKEDGKYHIYEMSEDGTSGVTLARTYAEGGGFDIIKSGNGYLNGMTKVGECQSNCPETEKVYYFGDCGKACSYDANYTTCSPLSFDLNGDGVKTSDKIIDYDIDGDGVVDKINDSADAVLVFDKDGDGVSGENGSECFGNNTDIDGDGVKDGYKDGFEALKALATKAGVINGADDMVIDENDIKLLEEEYGLKIKTGGYNSEATSLLDAGITEINLAKTSETTLQDDFDGNGNQLMTQEGATFKVNGEEREYADIWHKKQNESAPSSSSISFGKLGFSSEYSELPNFSDLDSLINSTKELKKATNKVKTPDGSDLEGRIIRKPTNHDAKADEKEEIEEKKLEEERLEE